MLSKEEIRDICKKLLINLEKKKELLKSINKKITQDSDYCIIKDYENLKKYLINYTDNIDLKRLIKPKGSILLILSYNEPFLMSVVPLLNALVCENEVFIKPSRKNIQFVSELWEDVLEEQIHYIKEDLKFEDKKFDLYLDKVSAVYFYGSIQVAKTLYSICAIKYIEFYPELEGADVKIFFYNDTKSEDFIRKDVLSLLRQSFSHNGQMCQRIQGIYVDSQNYTYYLKILKDEFNKISDKNLSNNYMSFNYKVNNDYSKIINKYIKDSNSEEVCFNNNYPILLINPQIDSTLVLNAYFFPMLWIVKIDSFDFLIETLNKRKFFLGLNIYADVNLVDIIIESTKFARYTVNRNHINIDKDYGWGGNYPTSFGGYQNWLEKFGNIYNILK